MSELIHVLASEADLIERAVELNELRNQTYLNDARKEQISKQMGHIFFELQARNEVVLLGAGT